MCILLNVKKHEKTFALNVDIFKKSDKRIKSLQKDAFYDKVNASFFMHVSVQNSHLLD